MNILGWLGIALLANGLGSGAAYVISADKQCRELGGRSLIKDWSVVCKKVPPEKLQKMEQDFRDRVQCGYPGCNEDKKKKD